MQHFPIFLDLRGKRVLVGGGGAAAVAKLRLILKTEARIEVFCDAPVAEIIDWAEAGRLAILPDALMSRDHAQGAALAYGAYEDAGRDARFVETAQSAGVLTNIVDNLQDSQFITPAIVDRDPVIVAIGTEGAAPVLARAIKADLEERLPSGLGMLARIGKAFRHAVEALPFGAPRRDFWREYYFETGPKAAPSGEAAVQSALGASLERHLAQESRPGEVVFVGAGPGDPELLTLKARKALDRADVVIHDRLVSPEILELARREAEIINVGKTGFGPSVTQAEINRLIVEHASHGAMVVRLKGGDPGVFGRLDEEVDAVTDAAIDYSIIPGITAASAAAASLGQSLTKRGRNSDMRLLTGHDVAGFAEQDWKSLAAPGSVAAIYMGKKAARFLSGRLLMHGAGRATPVTLVENVSRPDQRILATTVAALSETVQAVTGPAVILLGLAPRQARAELATLAQTLPPQQQELA